VPGVAGVWYAALQDEVVMFDAIGLKGVKYVVSSPISWYAVYDGHGGRKAAEFTRDHLVRNLVANLEKGQDAGEALTGAFVKTDADFVASPGSVRTAHCACV
jgi:serine/threonine protein phosphatase PrpC